MILVTGATGQLGRLLLDFILLEGKKPQEVAVLVRNLDDAAFLKEQGFELRLGNYDDLPSLMEAFRGIKKLVFISSSEIVGRSLQHLNVVEAAKASGVEWVLYTSFERKDETAASPLWSVAESHLATERALMASGLSYTILRNNLYMDFIPMFIGEQVFDRGLVYLPAGNGRLAAVLRSDLAEAMVKLIYGSGHDNKVYRFSHVEAFSYQEITDFLAELSARPLSYVSPSVEEYKAVLLGAGLAAGQVEILAGFAWAQALGELGESSLDLSLILGRAPRGLKDFLAEVYAGRF